MCLIIHSPKDHVPTKYIVESALEYNPDGVGIMYMNDGKPFVSKSLNATIKSLTKKLEKLAQTEYAIHFRMKTHGKIDIHNTHPYDLNGGRFLMHNGILPISNQDNPAKSDTWHFIHKILNPILERGHIEWDKVGKSIGSSNKFAVLDPHEGINIVNRDTGLNYEGAWYSNTYAWDAPASSRFGSRDWGTHTAVNRDRYWDDDARYGSPAQAREDDRDELFFTLVDNIADALYAGDFHYDLGNVVQSYESIYDSLSNMTDYDMVDIMDAYFKAMRGANR
jgi:hypothetical protein